MQGECENDPQDDDSLFGSPPPSPSARGRSPSPALALPSTPSAGSQILSSGSSAQNVGTIALPGSHTHSEPSINPLAVSLSLPGGSCTPLLPQSLPSSGPQSRQGSVGRNESAYPALQPRSHSSSVARQKTAPPRKRAPKRKLKEQMPRPAPPAISLPDPAEPPPAHFLRNQQALLGHAGLIARVKPSKLTLSGTPRGASPSNPIVLDDREADPLEPPIIGRSQTDHLRSLDLSKLPPPTNQEIVEMLIKQRDIFPVLQSILKLLAAGALGGKAVAPTPTPVTKPQAPGPDRGRALFRPPLKRRKLNRVPAGAVDWDVPYPFREGEGPEAYEQTWLKERGRQLISQLISLVKIAARKAAAKKHLAELKHMRQNSSAGGEMLDEDVSGNNASEPQGGRGANHYRDVNGTACSTVPMPQGSTQEGRMTTPPPVGSESVSSVSVEGSHSVLDPTQPPAGQNVNVTPSSTATFNDLFSALLAASDTNASASVNPTSLSSSSSSEPSISSGPATGPHPSFGLSSLTDGDTDQSLIDSWMNILQTFQVGGTCTGNTSSDHLSLESLLGFNPSTNETPSSFSSPASGDLSSFSTTPNPDAQQAQSFSPLDLSQLGDLDFALNLVNGNASTPDSLGSNPSLTSGASLPMDFNFDLPPSERENSIPAQEYMTTIDQTPIVQSPPVAGTPTSVTAVPAGLANANIDSLIDPQLLALSLPDSSASLVALPRASSSIAAQDNVGQFSGESRSPSSSLASPLSPLEPATPSSAGWEMNISEVAVGESNSHLGTWWDGFLASIAEADPIGVDSGGMDPARGSQEDQGHKTTPQFPTSEGSAPYNKSILSERNSRIAIPRVQNTKRSTQPPSNAPGTSAPPQSSGVFQVLRVTDWQPQKPVQKLKKKDVLKKAEEKRAELKAKLEKVKLKLWETTIEHGALLHLMRLSTESEKASSSSSLS